MKPQKQFIFTYVQDSTIQEYTVEGTFKQEEALAKAKYILRDKAKCFGNILEEDSITLKEIIVDESV